MRPRLPRHRRPARCRLPRHHHRRCGRHLGQAQACDQHYRHRQFRRHPLSGHRRLRGQSRQNRPAHRTRPDRPHFSRGRGQNAETPAQGHRLGGAQKRRLRGARAARHWPVHRNASAHHRHRRQQNHSRIPGHRICAFQARRPGGQTVHPTDQLDQVSKYIGAEAPKLNKLGGSDWAATKPRPASTSTRSPTT